MCSEANSSLVKSIDENVAHRHFDLTAAFGDPKIEDPHKICQPYSNCEIMNTCFKLLLLMVACYTATENNRGMKGLKNESLCW